MQQELLPLFPLEMVLLPGLRVPLHIFEDRYKEMIGEAIRRKSEFGIVLATEQGILNAGCSAAVDRVVKEYDDGRLDIIAAGRRRFEILSLDEERSFLRGQVEFFDDEDTEMPDLDLQAKVRAGYAELQAVGDAEDQPMEPEVPFSFRVAQAVHDLSFRQVMLATRSESERLRRLAQVLPEMVQKIRHLSEVRALSGRNGHAKHIQS